jgi:hypothetical protein
MNAITSGACGILALLGHVMKLWVVDAREQVIEHADFVRLFGLDEERKHERTAPRGRGEPVEEPTEQNGLRRGHVISPYRIVSNSRRRPCLQFCK